MGVGTGVVNSVAGGGPLSVGANDQSSTFASVIQNTGGFMGLTKVGNGTVTLPLPTPTRVPPMQTTAS